MCWRGKAKEWAVPGAVAVVETARLSFIATLPERRLAQYVPDDAFYYLVLARNFALHGRWTFDGVEPASGFHLVWAYLLAAMYRVAPGVGLHGIVVAGGLVQGVAMTAAAWLVCRTGRRVFGEGVEAGIAVVLLSAISLVVSTAMMETPLVLLVAAAVLDRMLRTEVATRRWTLAGGALLGMMGTLVRSDFSLLPLCLLAMQAVLWRRKICTAAMVRLGAALLAGAGFGLLVVALHTHWISGQWVQSSARIKLFWTLIAGPSLLPLRLLLFQFFDVSAYAGWMGINFARPKIFAAVSVFGYLMFALVAAGVILRCRRGAARAGFAWGLVANVIAYVFVYRYNSLSLQQWYTGAFEMPLALLAGGATSYFLSRFRVATATVCAGLCVLGVLASFGPFYFWQDAAYEAAQYVRAHPELKPVGAWNAGALGYFAGGGVVNLDGLVNDRILPYARAGTLSEYVQQRQLHSIFDYAALFQPWMARLGGYGDGALKACVEEESWKGDPLKARRDRRLTLYRVRAECER